MIHENLDFKFDCKTKPKHGVTWFAFQLTLETEQRRVNTAILSTHTGMQHDIAARSEETTAEFAKY
jgi:hypothetical protein